MNYKKTGAEKSTITRDLVDLGNKTGNIYKTLSVVAKRSNQINRELKDELVKKLDRGLNQFVQYNAHVINCILIKNR